MLIGLNGNSRAGKDSVAGILVRNYGFRQVALATKIREILLDLNPYIDDNPAHKPYFLKELYENCDGDWDRIKSAGPGSVDWMIALGQSLRDRLGEDVWINAAFPKGMSGERRIVISDIRQPNEVTWVQENGGELWHIERPDGAQKRGMDGLLSGVHWDAHIVNDGTLADLEETVRQNIEV